MGKRGRPAIPRGEVQRRDWWHEVAIGRPMREHCGYPGKLDGRILDEHWYWMSDRPGIAGVTTTGYAKPQRVLCHQLRPEYWDEHVRGDGARARVPFNNNCGDAACINPWHFKFAADGGEHLDEFGAMRKLAEHDLEQRLNKKQLKSCYDAYAQLLTDPDADKMLGVGQLRDGRIKTGATAFQRLLWEPWKVAMVEKWLAEDPLMTLQEAENCSGEIAEELASEVQAVNDFNERLAAARSKSGITLVERSREAEEEAPTGHRKDVGIIPRPRPRRRPTST